MTTYQFDRHCRTPHSEVYLIRAEGEEVGRIDLHYGQNVVYGTLVVLDDRDAEQISELIELIDEQLVLTADVTREDFVITVFTGRQVGIYSDDTFEEDEDDLDEQRNGH
ncbi:MAG: hypothetical protein RMM58_06400 [Chloroflexota bacterium]|nr:hypothetical protein [Dehalococcoidia bacterium]MDW8253493.1 hypothetical protein [Chloroflexota bacterium]